MHHRLDEWWRSQTGVRVTQLELRGRQRRSLQVWLPSRLLEMDITCTKLQQRLAYWCKSSRKEPALRFYIWNPSKDICTRIDQKNGWNQLLMRPQGPQDEKACPSVNQGSYQTCEPSGYLVSLLHFRHHVPSSLLYSTIFPQITQSKEECSLRILCS